MKKILLLLVLFSLFLQAQEKSIILKIDGMTCPLCTMAIKKSLRSTEGVKKVKVSLPKKRARILYESEKVDVTTLIKAIEKVGYSAEIERSKD